MNSTIEVERVKKDRRINFSALLIRTLFRWKIILLVMLVGGCAFSVRNYYSQEKLIEAAGKDIESGSKSTESYQQYYNTQKELLGQALRDRYDYMQNSILISLNPYSSSITEITINIKGPEKSTIEIGDVEKAPDGSESSTWLSEDSNVSSTASALKDFIKSGIDWSVLKSEMGVSKDIYFNELVNTEQTGSILTIDVVYKNKKGVKKISEVLLEQVQEKFKEIVEKQGLNGYELTVLNNNVSDTLNEEKAGWLHSRVTEIQSYIEDLQNIGDNYSEQEGIVNEERAVVTINWRQVLKRAVYGALVGLIISFLAIMVWILLKAQVLSAKEMNEYYETESFGVLPKKYHGKPIRGLNVLIQRLSAEDRSGLSRQDRLRLAVQMVEQKSNAGDQVALVGDVDNNTLEDFSDIMNRSTHNIKFIALDNVMEDFSERELLISASSVVLVAQVEKTKYSYLNDISTIVAGYNKKIVGTLTC